MKHSIWNISRPVWAVFAVCVTTAYQEMSNLWGEITVLQIDDIGCNYKVYGTHIHRSPCILPQDFLLISMLLRLLLNKRTLNRAILFLSQCFCSSFKTMGDTYFDINAFKAHSKQKAIKQSDTLFISMLLQLFETMGGRF